MSKRRQDFALGLASILFLGLFVATILFLFPIFQEQGRPIVIHFDHEEGMAPLSPGGAVILGGSLQVGTVTNVYPQEIADPNTGAKRTVFVVETEIRPDVPLYGNAVIATDQPAIGGPGFVSIISVGDPNVPLKQPIAGQPPRSLAASISLLSERILGPKGLLTDLEQVLDPRGGDVSLVRKLLVSLDDVNAMTAALRADLDPHQREALLAKIHAVADDLNATTTAIRRQIAEGDDAALLAKVHAALDHLNHALSDVAGMLQEDRPLVRDTLTSVAHAAGTLDRELIDRLRDQLDPSQPASAAGKLHFAIDQLNAALANVEAATAEGERMVLLSRPTLEQILANFREMSANLNQAGLEVLLDPSRLLAKPGPERRSDLLTFQAARSFAEAAGELDNAVARLDALVRALPTEGPAAADRSELQEIQKAVRAAFQRFDQAERALWEQLKSP